MKTAIWVLGIATVVLGFLFAKSSWDNSSLKLLNMLQYQEIELMRDECREYQFKLTSNPTYEEGYKAALLRRNNGSYSDGYEDAKIVYDGSNNYTQGYHAAITQFGFLKDMNKDTAAKIDSQPATEKKEEAKTY
jgi:hypothetical protein